MNFNTLAKKIRAGKYNQSNYQLLVICQLSSSDKLKDSKKNLAQVLANKNKAMKKETSFFMSCPVWKVLTNKGIITKVSDGYKLNTSLTNAERAKIVKLCKELIQ